MANMSTDRQPMELAVYEGMTAAANADDAWGEVDAFLRSLQDQGYKVVLARHGEGASWWEDRCHRQRKQLELLERSREALRVENATLRKKLAEG